MLHYISFYTCMNLSCQMNSVINTAEKPVIFNYNFCSIVVSLGTFNI